MAESDDSIPETVPDRHADATGELTSLAPGEAQQIAAEIKAIAESRGDDSQVVELVETYEPSRRSKRTTMLPPMPAVAEQPAPPRRRTRISHPRSCATPGPCSISRSAPTACASCRVRTPRTSSSA